MRLTFGSLFAGIGGFDLGFERAGMVCKWQVEIDPFCCQVLAKHWPNVERFEDVRQTGKHNLRPVDVICGGFPCQDISPASPTKNGIQGSRSGLWSEYYRIICEIQPKWVVIENHSNLLSSNNGEDFREILWEFSSIGYDAEWATLSAKEFGALHERRRLFIVSYTNKGYGPKGVGDNSERAAKIFRKYTEKRSKIWLQAPNKFNGVADGLSRGLYRNRVGAIGNAVVPQIAEFIGKRIIEAST